MYKEEKEEMIEGVVEEVKIYDVFLENIEICNISMFLDVKLNVKVRIG